MLGISRVSIDLVHLWFVQLKTLDQLQWGLVQATGGAQGRRFGSVQAPLRRHHQHHWLLRGPDLNTF